MAPRVILPFVIPSIDIGSLFGADSAVRREVDRAIVGAAAEVGFIQVGGLPPSISPSSGRLQQLKRIFSLPPEQQHPLWRQKFAAAHDNIYRGWFPLQEGHPTYKEGIDIGPDVAHGVERIDAGDPLCEGTPLPAEPALPGWRTAVAAYYRGMEQTGQVMMRSIARGLDLPEDTFGSLFERGISTLRLIRYPPRADGAPTSGAAHVDSGLLTLLAQDGVGGLQAKHRSGTWIDVPAAHDSLVVNFGRLMELWTAGRIRATEHRVIGVGQERYSVPFFYEPRVDALIAPLPPAETRPRTAAFLPFLYGDFVWAAATRFVEFSGLQHRRPPRGGALPHEMLK